MGGLRVAGPWFGNVMLQGLGPCAVRGLGGSAGRFALEVVGCAMWRTLLGKWIASLPLVWCTSLLRDLRICWAHYLGVCWGGSLLICWESNLISRWARVVCVLAVAGLVVFVVHGICINFNV